MKKIIAWSCSLIIMIIMIGNIIGILAEEADTFNITIGDVVVSPSSKVVELPVHVGCQDLSAMTMELEFSKGLRFIGVNSNLNGISKNLNENLILYTSFISSKNKPYRLSETSVSFCFVLIFMLYIPILSFHIFIYYSTIPFG